MIGEFVEKILLMFAGGVGMGLVIVIKEWWDKGHKEETGTKY